MSKNTIDLRFCVGSEGAGVSLEWRLWATKKGDVYLGAVGAAGSVKVSFHRSGVSRYAFTMEHGTPQGAADRRLVRWLAPEVPPGGTNSFAVLGRIGVATDYLSAPREQRNPRATFLPPAPPGAATIVEVGLSEDALATVLELMGQGPDRGIAAYGRIEESRALLVRWYHVPHGEDGFTVPASHGRPGYRFGSFDPGASGRPIRIAGFRPPSDGHTLDLFDVGGAIEEP